MQRVFILTLSLVMLLTMDVKSRESAIEAVDTENLEFAQIPQTSLFQMKKGKVFENAIADLLGEKLNIPVVYEYFPQVIGYVRNTLIKKSVIF